MNGLANSHSQAHAAAWVVYVAILVLIGCSERTLTIPAVKQLSTRIVVSAPVGQSGAVAHLARSVARTSRTSTAAGDDSVVYVSMPPGMVPGGENATLRDLATGQTLTVTMANGGFDPAPLSATTGDTLEVDVYTRTGIVVEFNLVPPNSPPTLVRTDPPKGKTDVPLNTQILIVFSEPVNPASVASAVRLLDGSTVIAGSVTLSATDIEAEFTPDSALQPETSYELVVDTTLRSWKRDALESAIHIPFTTATRSASPASAAASLVVSGVPNTVPGGVAIAVTVTARDSAGSTGFPYAGTVHISSSDRAAQLPSEHTFTPADWGSFTFAVTFGTGGTQTVTAVDMNASSVNGSATFNVTPLTSPNLDFASVSVAHAGSHSCGVTTQGAAYCWGDSQSGVLGNGTLGTFQTPALVPTPVAGGFRFSAVSAGWEHTCALTTTGAAYCWGGAAFLSGNQGALCPSGCLSPTPLPGGLSFAQVSSGETHTCGVTTLGMAYCWGSNDWGQLGNGSDTSTMAPVAVSGSLTFASISAGEQTTCGITTGGAAYCWGQNLIGELGIGGAPTGPEQCPGDYPTDPTIPCSHLPVRVAGGLTFRFVKVGYRVVCGITTSGAAYCWGANSSGQLGLPTAQSPNDCTPSGAADRWPCSTAPIAVWGGLTFTALDVGGDVACAVTSTGAAYCWGANRSGSLGDGTLTSRAIPIAVSGGLVFQTVSTNGFSSCGVTTASVAYCWGALGGGLTGALGNGTTTGSLVPVKVALQP